MTNETKICPQCNGKGTYYDNGELKECPTCNGKTKVKKTHHDEMSDGSKEIMGFSGGALLGYAVGGLPGGLAGSVIGAIFSGDSDDEDIDINGK